MMRKPGIVFGVLMLLAGTAILAPADSQPAQSPPTPLSAGNAPGAQDPNAPPQSQDMYCRQQAAAQSGYRGPDGNDSADANAAEQRYASAYYACMNSSNQAGPPPDGYAYEPPPPPYYYPPYPYPYPYYYPPYYYGPAVTFGFGFGGFHGRWR